MKKRVLITSIISILVLIIISYLMLANQKVDEPSKQIIESNEAEIFIPESIEAAKSRQIQTLYDKVEIENLQDLKSEDLCTIIFEKEEITSNELGKARFTFDESLVGEKVKISCDQFERFGFAEDELLDATVTSTSNINENFDCDYGRVTTPTVYFWFISSSDLGTDYCVSPLTVLSQEKDAGSCFSTEEIDEMKSVCENQGKPPYEIPDANGCPTIYCGWDYPQNLCPSEGLLEESKTNCEAEGNTAVRYSVEVEGQDFPCAQIRCNQCPTSQDLTNEKQICTSQGGLPEELTDDETSCNFIHCTSP